MSEPALIVVLDKVVYFQLAPVGLVVLGGLLMYLLTRSLFAE